MKNQVVAGILLALSLTACSHMNQQTSRGPAADEDRGPVQVSSADSTMSFYFWEISGNTPVSFKSKREAAYDKEIEKGNICLRELKAEYEALKSNNEVINLCERYKAANDFLSGRQTACVIVNRIRPGLTAYFTTTYLTAPYIANGESIRRSIHLPARGPYLYHDSYLFEEVMEKELDRKSYAKALENGKCHLATKELVEQMQKEVLNLEGLATARRENAKAKKDLIEAKQDLDQCEYSLPRLKEEVETQILRINHYVPDSWISAAEKSQVIEARRRFKLVESYDGKGCAQLHHSLRESIVALKNIQGRAPSN